MLDHIAIIISDEKNLGFYNKLGFIETNRYVRPTDVVVLMKKEELTLEIFVDSNHPKRMTNPEALGLRHFALSVDDLNDIDLPMETIRTDWNGYRFTFVKDPNGLPIELKERKRE